jgi:acyl carrier protein
MKNTEFTLEASIRAYLNANHVFDPTATYSDDTSFLSAGLIDSVGVMDLTAWVESQFDLPIDGTEVTADNFDSIGKLARFIQHKLDERDKQGFVNVDPDC